MTSFSQLGDPVCAACLCEHHGAAYGEMSPPGIGTSRNVYYTEFATDTTITSVTITITERCCIDVNAAMIIDTTIPVTAFEIERPLGTIRTIQQDEVTSSDLKITHHAGWEVLDPGTYTYYLVNHNASSIYVFGAWIKAIASDCEG